MSIVVFPFFLLKTNLSLPEIQENDLMISLSYMVFNFIGSKESELKHWADYELAFSILHSIANFHILSFVLFTTFFSYTNDMKGKSLLSNIDH